MSPTDADYPARVTTAGTLAELDAHLIACCACPRLVAWRQVSPGGPLDTGAPHWAKPVPGFGDPRARIALVGLAPGGYGANRTGRMFTGDKSGDFLVAALYAAGLANQATSTSADDGLILNGVRLTAPVRCAPPENRPTATERVRCGPYLATELRLLSATLRVLVILGGFGWQATWATLAEQGWPVPRPRPTFRNGAQVRVSHDDGRDLHILGSFHPSPQNTNTGRLTPAMFGETLATAKRLAQL